MIFFYVIALIVIILGIIFIYNNHYSFTTTTYLSLNSYSQYKAEVKSLHPSNNDNKNYIWKIKDKSIATISEDGIITPIKNGITILIIKSKKGFNTRKITVEVSGLKENATNNIINDDGNESNNNIDNSNDILIISDIYLTVGTNKK